jgi:hypothetical protein
MQNPWLVPFTAENGGRDRMRRSIAAVNAERRSVLREAFAPAVREYGKEKELPVEAVTAMTMTFALGYMLESLSGIREGQEALLAWVDGWIESLERGKHDGPRKSKRPGRTFASASAGSREQSRAREPDAVGFVERDGIASAIASEIGRKVDYLDVETDGARKAAARIADKL